MEVTRDSDKQGMGVHVYLNVYLKCEVDVGGLESSGISNGIKVGNRSN